MCFTKSHNIDRLMWEYHEINNAADVEAVIIVVVVGCSRPHNTNSGNSCMYSSSKNRGNSISSIIVFVLYVNAKGSQPEGSGPVSVYLDCCL